MIKQLFIKKSSINPIAALAYAVVFLCALSSCQLNREALMRTNDSVLVLLAHPDDETWISGTLAKLAAQGVEVIPVYATSGDKGSDRSGQGLSGSQLAEVREVEAIDACQVLGVSSPIFLRFADGQLNQLQPQLLDKFKEVVERVNPVWIISFVQGGITDNRDHKTVNKLLMQHFTSRAVYFAVSDKRANSLSRSAEKFGIHYAVANPIGNGEVTYRVDVSQYQSLRAQAMARHSTQFPSAMVRAFTDFTQVSSDEELVLLDDIEHLKALTNYLD